LEDGHLECAGAERVESRPAGCLLYPNQPTRPDRRFVRRRRWPLHDAQNAVCGRRHPPLWPGWLSRIVACERKPDFGIRLLISWPI